MAVEAKAIQNTELQSPKLWSPALAALGPFIYINPHELAASSEPCMVPTTIP
jgi:hypothetical protein